jgi:hypothetical protein
MLLNFCQRAMRWVVALMWTGSVTGLDEHAVTIVETIQHEATTSEFVCDVQLITESDREADAVGKNSA